MPLAVQINVGFHLFLWEETRRLSNYLSVLESVVCIRGSVFVLVHILFLDIFVCVEANISVNSCAKTLSELCFLLVAGKNDANCEIICTSSSSPVVILLNMINFLKNLHV